MQMDANADFAMQTMPTSKTNSKSKTTSSSTPTATVGGENEVHTNDGTCCQMSTDVPEEIKTFETPPPIDFEKQRAEKLKAFIDWAQKGGTG